jgi:hypothetical protein
VKQVFFKNGTIFFLERRIVISGERGLLPVNEVAAVPERIIVVTGSVNI